MTQTKERGIIMQAHNVRAILDGRKTMTRRIVKPQPKHRLIEGLAHITIGMDAADDGAVWYDADCINPGREVRCPYGRVGDTLWVREKFGIENPAYVSQYKSEPWRGVPDPDNAGVLYWEEENRIGSGETFPKTFWRSPIHMPRWASHITLEIVGVRVERVQDISEADARAEGIIDGGCLSCGEPEPCNCSTPRPNAVDSFVRHWIDINGADSWESNAWCWVISFKRIEGN